MCVSYGLLSSACLFIFISMHIVFVFSIVCFSVCMDLFILLLRVFFTVRVCVFPPSLVEGIPQSPTALCCSHTATVLL